MDAALGRAFDVSCHVGTLVAVLAFFQADVLAMVRALPRAFSSAPGPDGRRIWLIAAGTVPVVIVGGLWAKTIEESLRTPVVAVVTLILGAIFFLVAERAGRQNKREGDISVVDAVAIGVAQSAALIPGVSRSGATIATGLFLGLDRATAARFTFLMSVPAILAAAAKEGLDLRHVALSSNDFLLFAIGAVTSAIVGYLTIKFFLRFLVGHRLDVFAWYRLALAGVAIVWLGTR